MRDMIKFIVTIITVITVLFCNVPGLLEAAVLLDRVVALVNKEVITWSDLYKLMEYETTDQVKTLNEEERMKIFKESEPAFLEKLIDMRLQIQEARRLGLEVTPEEVRETIESVKKKYSLTASA